MYICGRYGHGGRIRYEREWRANPDIAGGGELLDQGVHLIDLARWFAGNFTEIWEYPGADASWRSEDLHLLDCIRTGVAPSGTLADAQAALAIVERVYDAAARREHADGPGETISG
jgi:predicted dehydrogenase